ncbi:DNA polymerase III subunit delta' [Aestuariicella hydrocarbonica]|uniref:DNA polymerase III subunit delta' n=1 Tax=Pseudomaricurvus hydrocarbonicus TaxID=1470433 RepID=A0A9E5JUQ3_9GAMM|nr:DNA polymerase III subunit delta' [Aestuariicella hydrocarbonica]NHO65245.1 DNA polymerase III subunit delta' [Aestuariicella hydrocarbonica]
MVTETEVIRESLAIPYAWQMQPWERLCLQNGDQKLPHALMFNGQRGIGKLHFARALAVFMLCLSPVNRVACGRCKGCELNLAGTHPDLFVLRPDEGSKVIKIDQVRRLTEFFSKTSQQGGKKVAIIEPVEGLNVNAANALLKSLEEPSGDSSLLLISHVPSQVMATIRSRCQQLSFPIPNVKDSLAWLTPLAVGRDAAYLLDCAGGAPLAALGLLKGDELEQRQALADGLLALAEGLNSALDVAADFQRGEPLPLIEAIMQWLQLGLKQQQAGQQYDGQSLAASSQQLADTAKQPDKSLKEIQLIAIIAAVPHQILFRFWDKVVVIKRQLLSSANPNKQLVLEELMMDWQALTKQSVKISQSRQQMMNGLL